ncbi:uncharacterized protein LOC122056405 isoform X1 [Zingiber officinale]|nr:uncharacterized protein LOC122056405 isoform X1 [Zingiber officinale]XP_042474287.1 uncharacterized protein LOC122056405 isoform X1 [Zingiber officinale]XP_042474295.1 uncharacterized protein LOC122056405 isoform X1 [Zingiber officinale]XP_042474303.1 uncharacterized protein LOC122056405 isoform X1 [Zingiber officinale]
MNVFQSSWELQNPESFSGCMRKMISMLNLSAGMARSRLLTERPHQASAKGVSNVIKRSIYPVAEDTGKQRRSEQRSRFLNKISGRTQVKMLISQEMCGDTGSREKPPSVIAKLMGLDSIPVQKSETSRGKVKGNSNALTGELTQCQWQEGNYVGKPNEEDIDAYEVETPRKDIWIEEQSLQKVRVDENSNQRRMVLVREKFLEAKRLATDGKLVDSQEFQDAVEVLNSNRDLFIKFLEESNSVLTKKVLKQQNLSLPSQTTLITVLKPSNTRDSKGNQLIENQLLSDSNGSIGKRNSHYWSTGSCEPMQEALSQGTRIVVLKPIPGKPFDTKTILPSNLPILLDTHSSNGDLIISDELSNSRKALEEVSEDEEGTLCSNTKYEALSSSVLSNGYIGDESSFNRSDCAYLEDEIGSTSQSDVATSAIECWDYINKIGSPLSTSSSNQTSHSPESSVIIEAKKGFSERLAAVESNVNFQEARHLKTNSTLGEMFAIPESMKEGNNEDLPHSTESFDAEDALNAPSGLLPSFGINDKHPEENSQQNLLRFKLLPVSTLAHRIHEFNVGTSGSSMTKPIVQAVVPKSNNRKLSFKGMVSSFFFPKSKRPSRDKPSRAASVSDVLSSFNDTFVPRIDGGTPNESYDRSTEMLMLPMGVSKEKSGTCGIHTEYQDKSVHNSASEDMLLYDAYDSLSESSGPMAVAGCPSAVSRSPLIKSVVRSLSRCTFHLDSESTKLSNPFMVFMKADEEYEQFAFLQKLLSSSGINNNNQMVYGGWYSLDCPLNPSLLSESLHMEDGEDKCQEMCSSKRLLFDSINTALLDIGQLVLFTTTYPWNQGRVHGPWKDSKGDATVAEQVWAIVKKGLAGDKWVPKDPCSGNNMVDGLVKEEMAGRQWDETRWLEVCEFSKEIGGKVLEELVEESLSELSPH